MIRERLTRRTRKVTVGVAGSRVVSVRSNDELDTVVRMYADGRVGLASAVGPHDRDGLERQAASALAHGVPFAPGPVRERVYAFDHPGEVYDAATLVRATRELLDVLRGHYPDFVFSHEVSWSADELAIRNDVGLDLRWSCSTTQVVIVVKQKGSPNILDTLLVVDGPSFDMEAAVAQAGTFLPAFRAGTAPAPTGRVRVVFEGVGPLAGRLQSDLTARSMASGASVFRSDTSVNEAFRLLDCRDPTQMRVCPFDLYGTLREEPELTLLGPDGACGVADRRDADTLGVPDTGSAGGKLHELPRSAVGALRIPGTGALAPLVDDGAVLVCMAMGADCSDAGDYALPVQLAYLLDAEGRPTLRLPQLTLTGNVFELFGSDWVGATETRARPGVQEHHVVTHMTVA
jgi:PmbA protein